MTTFPVIKLKNLKEEQLENLHWQFNTRTPRFPKNVLHATCVMKSTLRICIYLVTADSKAFIFSWLTSRSFMEISQSPTCTPPPVLATAPPGTIPNLIKVDLRFHWWYNINVKYCFLHWSSLLTSYHDSVITRKKMSWYDTQKSFADSGSLCLILSLNWIHFDVYNIVVLHDFKIGENRWIGMRFSWLSTSFSIWTNDQKCGIVWAMHYYWDVWFDDAGFLLPLPHQTKCKHNVERKLAQSLTPAYTNKCCW